MFEELSVSKYRVSDVNVVGFPSVGGSTRTSFGVFGAEGPSHSTWGFETRYTVNLTRSKVPVF